MQHLLLRRAQIPVVNADDLARAATAPNSEGIRQIEHAFGNNFILADGSLDRKKLASLIFNDPNARKTLESITHPLIAQKLQDRLKELSSQGKNYCVYSAPLLFEKSRQAQFLIPMAVSIVFGIIFATILTLFLLPILLSYLNQFKRFVYWITTGKWYPGEKVERAHIEKQYEEKEFYGE